MEKKRLLFVFNPKAGKGQIRTKLYEILDVFIKAEYEVAVHPTQEIGDGYHQIKSRAKDVDLVVCSGGDGTLDEAVRALMDAEVQVPLGYIPTGSTNDFANSLKISKDLVQAARDIVNGDIYPCDVGRFNETSFVYIAAFGLFTDVSYETNQNLKNILGHLAYLLEGTKRIFNVPTYRVKAETDEITLENDYIYGMITNSRSVGGFKNLMGKDVELNDGLFEVTLIRKPKNALELNEIITALLTRVDKTSLIDNFKTGHIRLTTEQEVSWTLDGEFGGTHQVVEIETRKHALEILINKDNLA